MASTYMAYLQMKNIFSNFPSEFYDKLTENEREKFQELVNAANSLEPQQNKTLNQKPSIEEKSYFQFKNLIFCLELKKLFSKSRLKFSRYSFALIRCLYKDILRTEKVKGQKPLLKINERWRERVKARKQKTQTKTEEKNEIEDFVYLERKNTKMTKKKKTLLRNSKSTENSIKKISKNHSWVLSFALIKWKKFYFSFRSVNQNSQSISILILQLLVAFSEKYKKKQVKFSFDYIKLRYYIISKNNCLKIWLVVKNISTVIKNKKKMALFKTFSLLNSLRKKKIPGKSENKQVTRIEDCLNQMFRLLKKLQKNVEIKNKIIVFLAIQNYQNEDIKFICKKKLKRMCSLLQKLLFIKKYVYFFELKEEAYVKYKKIEFLKEIIQEAIGRSDARMIRGSFIIMKSLYSGNIQTFMCNIEKVMNKIVKRETFEACAAYSVNLGNFLVLRNCFTSNLMIKIYYKRMSSSFLNWASYAENMTMMEELGLLPIDRCFKPTNSYDFTESSEYNTFSSSPGKSFEVRTQFTPDSNT
ncbi:hypothetical protein SteCoe_3326 [Stentor coeruleus]|uniref:Uncharacterized protein n=1 Tax=Stentor coeruleus TaxID=5963 RepID=A0A1R2CXD8_9CILI|nr:hypothetical protein SteCoe_3326 [Stentor coeruleus]